MTSNYTKEALDHVKMVAKCIATAGSIPSGHLYAQLMGYGYTLPVYERIVAVLEKAGLITVKSHLIIWKG